MSIHRLLIATLSLSMLGLGSCTAKFQDMIRDRDETIRDLEGKLASSRGENQRLKRDLERGRNDLNAMRNQAKASEASMSSSDKALDDMKRALRSGGIDEGDVMARYRGGRLSLGIANRVTFSAGSTALTKSGRAVLDRLARVLTSQYASKQIWVEGHTDSDPIRKTKAKFRSNRHLSSERADAVAAYLIRRGVPSSRVVIVGHGPNDPLSSGAKAENRRVEIVVTG